MKISDYTRTALTFTAACVLFLSMDGTSQARSANSESKPVSGFGTLTIRRIPNLGGNVIVDLSVDGVAVASIGYGHTYRAVLPAGRHLLSVQATPNPQWRTPWQMTLEVRNGQIYTFNVVNDGSGGLVLKSL